MFFDLQKICFIDVCELLVIEFSTVNLVFLLVVIIIFVVKLRTKIIRKDVLVNQILVS